MTVLVTGSEGRIGRVIVALLREHALSVRCFDATLGSGDLRDAEAVLRAVEGTDAVIHAGAIPSNVPGRETEVLDVGLRGTHHVLEACRRTGVGRVVCFSSVQALGIFAGTRTLSALPLDDDLPACPQNNYQLAKHLGEQLCATYHQHHGLTTLNLRPVYVSTPSEYPSWRQRPADAGPRQVTEYGAYVDVRDVAQAALLGLRAALPEPVSVLLTAADTDAPLPTAELLTRYYTDLPFHGDVAAYLAQNPYRSLVDCRAAQHYLGWQAQHSWRTES